MSDNPYKLEWVSVDDSQEDHLFEGMRVQIEEDSWGGVITAIHGCDGEYDEGRVKYYPTSVDVLLDPTEGYEECTERMGLASICVLRHELEEGKRQYEARLAKLRAERGIPVTAADFAPAGPVDDPEDIPF